MITTGADSDLNLEITGRHVKVTSALKSFTREKLVKLRRLIGGPLEIHAILTVEKHRHAAEIVARGRHLGLSARVVTDDMYTSIGDCVEKLESQARKHKEKLAARRRRAAAAEALPPPLPEPPAPPPRKARAGAGSALRLRKLPAATDEDGLQIVRTPMPRRKPMSVEEAAQHVMEAELGFIVFRNDRSQSINILYRRKDGRLGLIEPEG